MSSFSLSFSSSLHLSPLPSTNNKCTSTSNNHAIPTFVFRCASASSSTVVTKKRHWKEGEYPGYSQTSTPARSNNNNPITKKKHWKEGEYPGQSQTSSPGRSNNNNRIKNIKKKLDRKNDAKGWANTVTEALSDCIQKKQWLQALEVGFYDYYLFIFSFCCINLSRIL